MDIIKSPNDRRTFRYIKLENELEILLISDKETSSAAASLSINVGSFQEEEVAGLAHFLEHMLFMGSVKYPNENDYNTCIKENGGSSNAYTSDDNTTFYFNCVPEGLFKVLDIFAQFFTCPLLKEDTIKREMCAVDSEYKNSLMNESFHIEAAKKQLTRADHPISNFSMGCIETLDVPNIREILTDFYNKYYSSHLMKLAVIGQESLDEMEARVRELFSTVPRRDIMINNDYGTLYDAPVNAIIIPIKDNHEMSMAWELVLDDNNLDHVCNFMGHIVGHEGSGSLFDLLYQKLLVKSLTAGISDTIVNRHVFTIKITFTDLGFQKIDLVKTIILQYLNLVSNSPYEQLEKLYTEYKKVHEMLFANYVIPSAGSEVTRISSIWSTHQIDPKYLIAFSFTFNDYNHDIHTTFTNLFKKMNCDNAIIFTRSKSYEHQDLKEEKWYKSKYAKCIDEFIPVDIDYKLTLPFENKYICDNISMNKESEVQKYPILLNIPNINLWWKHDTSYNDPKLFVECAIKLLKNMTVKDDILHALYHKCLRYIMNATLYDISCAVYSVEMDTYSGTIDISISGYPEKFMNVLEYVVFSLLSFKDNINQDIFNDMKAAHKLKLENSIYDPPYKLAKYELGINVVNNAFTKNQLLAELSTVTYADLVNYDLLGDKNDLNGLVQGNVNRDMAIKIGNHLSQLNSTNEKYILKEQLKSTSTNEFTQTLENKDETNSCHKLAVKIGYLHPDLNANHLETEILLYILDQLINEQYFDQLRTKDQLGYAVGSNSSQYGMDYSQLYTTYDFTIQSSSYSVEYLKNRTIRFIKEFRQYLENEPEDSINFVINSAISQLSQPFQNLHSEVMYNFDMIITKCNNFDFKNDSKEFTKTVTKQKILEFYDQYFSLEENSYWSMSLVSHKKSNQMEV